MAKKTPRPKAETPKGFRDHFGAEVTERQDMLAAIARIYHLYGFDPLETSAVETVEALGKFLPDVDRPNEGVFAWEEDDTWLALRYDMTAPLARVAAQYRNDLPSPYRRYSMGPVWRNEKPGPGRFRQFYQCDADTVGAASMAADAEICAMLADTLEEVGIPRGDYIVRVNNRKVLERRAGRFENQRRAAQSNQTGWTSCAPSPQTWIAGSMTLVACQPTRVLRTIDKYEGGKVGSEAVIELLTKGRRDQSGAFIEGVGLAEKDAHRIVQFLESKGQDNNETLSNLRN